ncbi:hypothetical protein TcasGA2_TC031635 [Tribolium castaneum]|uniref:Uncharacterized protein n=1 Tax=Tribolium castaneum TaxID=7070 RepID=A0A139WAT6_TRICA|nr:hypothetical protein TcasGA2_TC031635 [Tribolium castaneum]
MARINQVLIFFAFVGNILAQEGYSYQRPEKPFGPTPAPGGFPGGTPPTYGPPQAGGFPTQPKPGQIGGFPTPSGPGFPPSGGFPSPTTPSRPGFPPSGGFPSTPSGPGYPPAGQVEGFPSTVTPSGPGGFPSPPTPSRPGFPPSGGFPSPTTPSGPGYPPAGQVGGFPGTVTPSGPGVEDSQALQDLVFQVLQLHLVLDILHQVKLGVFQLPLNRSLDLEVFPELLHLRVSSYLVVFLVLVLLLNLEVFREVFQHLEVSLQGHKDLPVPSQELKEVEEGKKDSMRRKKGIIQQFPENLTRIIPFSPKFPKLPSPVINNNIQDITPMLKLDVKCSIFVQIIKLMIFFVPMVPSSTRSTWFVSGGTNLIVIQLHLCTESMQIFTTIPLWERNKDPKDQLEYNHKDLEDSQLLPQVLEDTQQGLELLQLDHKDLEDTQQDRKDLEDFQLDPKLLQDLGDTQQGLEHPQRDRKDHKLLQDLEDTRQDQGDLEDIQQDQEHLQRDRKDLEDFQLDHKLPQALEDIQQDLKDLQVIQLHLKLLEDTPQDLEPLQQDLEGSPLDLKLPQDLGKGIRVEDLRFLSQVPSQKSRQENIYRLLMENDLILKIPLLILLLNNL